MTDRDDTLLRAADLLRQCAEGCRLVVPAKHIEAFPYLPELEELADKLAEMTDKPKAAAQVPTTGNVGTSTGVAGNRPQPEPAAPDAPTPDVDALCRARLATLHRRTADGALPPVPEDPYAQQIIDLARRLERQRDALREVVKKLAPEHSSLRAKLEGKEKP